MNRFKELLKDFESIISGSSNKREELKSLNNLASNNSMINSRQRDAIMSRCEGFLAGKSYNFIENNNFKTYNINN